MEFTRELLELGGDLDDTLARVSVPLFALDDQGLIRWLNPAAVRVFGDSRGRKATHLVPPEELHDTKRVLARKLLGVDGTTSEVRRVRTGEGWASAEISSTPLAGGGRVVGVFGMVKVLNRARTPSVRPARLTPRQQEVLNLLAQGQSTQQIADRLSLTVETVRNHVRRILKALDVHSRLEAVVRAHELELV